VVVNEGVRQNQAGGKIAAVTAFLVDGSDAAETFATFALPPWLP